MKYKKRRARLKARIEWYKKVIGKTPTGASFSKTLKEMKKPGSFNK